MEEELKQLKSFLKQYIKLNEKLKEKFENEFDHYLKESYEDTLELIDFNIKNLEDSLEELDDWLEDDND